MENNWMGSTVYHWSSVLHHVAIPQPFWPAPVYLERRGSRVSPKHRPGVPLPPPWEPRRPNRLFSMGRIPPGSWWRLFQWPAEWSGRTPADRATLGQISRPHRQRLEWEKLKNNNCTTTAWSLFRDLVFSGLSVFSNLKKPKPTLVDLLI